MIFILIGIQSLNRMRAHINIIASNKKYLYKEQITGGIMFPLFLAEAPFAFKS